MNDSKVRELLRREEVEERFGAGRFPKPVRIGKRGVRWRVAELDEWAADRPVAHGEIGAR